MRTLSSLYREAPEAGEVPQDFDELDAQADAPGDRLPALVLDYVAERRDGLTNYFSSDIREGRRRRIVGRSHEVIIDFSGSRLVANFGTLRAGALVRSVDLIKRRLWDLKVERDGEQSPMLIRQHEMIVQAPPDNDPQVSSKQRENIKEALGALEAQADQEELRLRALATVDAIGDHVMEAEAA
jgi:hypothetical protein